MVILKDHIKHKSGESKTVCVTACLTALGVPLNSFHYSGHCHDGRREAILRRHGYAVRSRQSFLKKGLRVGGLRKLIVKLQERHDPKAVYMAIIKTGPRTSHCILLDHQGRTIVDTAPVTKRDARLVLRLTAIWRK